MVVDDFIPHKEPTLLLDTVEEVTPSRVVCKLNVGSRNAVAYTEDQELPVIALLEVMAQALSVWNSFYGNRGNRKNRFGILVNVSRLIVTRNSSLPKGMELRVSANLESNERGHVRFLCDVKDVLENEIIANAKLTGLVPNDTQIHDFVHQTELNAL
jgi:predicted hotdog family 3-hydroxylacyl-ACP dehydratase